MRCRRGMLLAGGIGALMTASVQSFAQPVNGSVTTRPLGQAAPALGWPMLILLGIVLASVALYRMRQRKVSSLLTTAAVVLLLGVAGLAYATFSVTISGDKCSQTVTSTFPAMGSAYVLNNCSNEIEIVEVDCPAAGDVLPDTETGGASGLTCTKGLVLPPAVGSCRLSCFT